MWAVGIHPVSFSLPERATTNFLSGSSKKQAHLARVSIIFPPTQHSLISFGGSMFLYYCGFGLGGLGLANPAIIVLRSIWLFPTSLSPFSPESCHSALAAAGSVTQGAPRQLCLDFKNLSTLSLFPDNKCVSVFNVY